MDALLRINGGLPGSIELADAVYTASEVLGISECYAHAGRYHFPLGRGWSIALSADLGGRIRVERCRLTIPDAGSTMWLLAGRRDRLAGLVKRLGQVAELA